MNRTQIEWVQFSSNPLHVVDRETGKRGWFCEKVSPGCAHCCASKLNVRRGTGHEYLPENSDKVEWRLNERELETILRRRKPTRIFVGDMVDLWHEDVPDEFIEQVFVTMVNAQQHIFQVLTKRPERFVAWCENYWLPRWAAVSRKLPPNIWAGTSVENQHWADRRVPEIIKAPTVVHFLSCEPLLGALDLRPWLSRCQLCFEPLQSDVHEDHEPLCLSWVILGGESAGPPERALVERCDDERHDERRHATGDTAFRCDLCQSTGWRPKPEALGWVRDIQRQCVAAGVPFFFKGWSGPTPKSGGRMLDGRTWNETPQEVPLIRESLPLQALPANEMEEEPTA